MQPRPAHLPDFDHPPLNEMVLGVQFASVPGFKSVHVQDVWDLYKDEFPTTQDQPLLQPIFETFGGMSPFGIQPFFMGGPPSGVGRVWFISETGNHLIQFQPDRLLINWQKNQNGQPYPHFEGILPIYSSSLRKLATLFKENFGQELRINQAEVIYINLIPVEEFSMASEYFKNWENTSPEIEGLNITISQVFYDSQQNPYARLIQEIQSAVSPDRKNKVYRMSLTFRGKPAGDSIDDAMTFLMNGREAVVLKFADLTTDKAHQLWGMKQ